MIYVITNSTDFISGSIASDRYLWTKQRKPTAPLHGLLFLISSKGSFTCTIPQTGFCYTSCVSLAGM